MVVMNIKYTTVKGFSALLLGAIVMASSCKKDDSPELSTNQLSQSGETIMATGTTSTSNLLFQNTFEATDALSTLYLEKANTNSITRSAEQARGGSNSVKFHLNKTDANVSGSKRSEALLEWQESPKFERWIGMSIFLPSSYVTDPAEESVFQWHAINSVDLDGASMNNAAIAMYTKNGRWELGMKYGGSVDLGVYDKNVWTDWVIHVKFSAGSDGVFEIWKNGKLMFERNGRNNYNDLKGNFFKIGIYKYAWPQGYASTTTSRTLYFDEIKIGNEKSSYLEVAPGSNNVAPTPTPTPTPIPTPTPTPTPTNPVLVAINGGGSNFKASNGITYQADKYFSGGFSHAVSTAVAGTTDNALFQNGHYGTNFSYNVPLANGTYDITFNFVENYNSASGQRQFDVLAEGSEIISNLDIFKLVGKSKVYSLTKTVKVTDGTLNLNFRTDLANADAMVSAFHITKSGSTVTPPPATSNPVVIAINGGGSNFKASNGITYQADKYFSGGFSHRVSTPVAGTTDDALFQNGHYGTNFSYNVPLASGTYDITFNFVENYNSASGQRQFDVLAEGSEIISNLDIFKLVGKARFILLLKL